VNMSLAAPPMVRHALDPSRRSQPGQPRSPGVENPVFHWVGIRKLPALFPLYPHEPGNTALCLAPVTPGTAPIQAPDAL
jgi:hypothetical protein